MKPILKYKNKPIHPYDALNMVKNTGEQTFEVWKNGEHLHNQIVHSFDGHEVKTTTNGLELNFFIP